MYRHGSQTIEAHETLSRSPGYTGTVSSRAVDYNAILKAPSIPHNSTMENWDHHPRPQDSSENTVSIGNGMWLAAQLGQSIPKLLETSAEEIFPVLRDQAIKKLGSFPLKDVDVLLAFGKNNMLTNGMSVARDENYTSHWKQIVEKQNKIQKKRRHLFEGGWEEDVTVTAYVVNISDVAAAQGGGLLNYLVKKSQTGTMPKEVWSFPCVRAVIDYKWNYWARKYIIVQFILYLGWVGCFSAYLIIYTEENLKQSFMDNSAREKIWYLAAYLCDGFSVLFMTPFVLTEIKTMWHYKLGWVQMWNVIDFMAYILQFIISGIHLFKIQFDEKAYHTLMAVQCITLYVKVQYFARMVNQGSSFVELLATVVSKVRFFFYFVVLTMVSVVLALSVLYMKDTRSAVDPQAEDEEENDIDKDFKNLARTFVTTYSVLLGDFNPSYVYDASNQILMGIVFVLFQVVMIITVLNLLIAMMTDSYSAIMKEQENMTYQGRAQAMDELEICLVKRFWPELKPFCHFLVVHRKDDELVEKEAAHIAEGESREKEIQETIRNHVTDIRSDVQDLKKMVQYLSKARKESIVPIDFE